MRMARGRIEAISIHAPRKGERLTYGFIASPKILFQSTLPARGSDGKIYYVASLISFISIHAPRKGERQVGLF